MDFETIGFLNIQVEGQIGSGSVSLNLRRETLPIKIGGCQYMNGM